MSMIDEIRERMCAVRIEDGEITGAELVEQGDAESIPGLPVKNLPEHIKVSVTCRPEEGSNIKIEVWMPVQGWNGDLVGVGNGGAAGAILSFMMAEPLRQGFAVATTDLGTSAGADCGIGNKAVWKDFGHRATHLMTLAAKEIVKGWYGRYPGYSYFSGGSTGGQQALMEAQRYPEDYDGILACAPAYDRTNLHLGFLWDWLALNAEGEGLFSADDEVRIVDAVLEQCGSEGDRRPGDAFLYRPDRIRMTKAVLEAAGLTQRQMDAVMKVYEGGTNPVTGTRLYEPTLTPGSEAAGMGLVHRCERENFAWDYFYIFRWVLGAEFDFTKFDFHRDAAIIHTQLDGDLNATDTDLSRFRDRGGKLLLIHGTADPIIPCASSIRYFEDVQKRMGDTNGFFRLFLAPGMAHMSGGPGVQDIVFGLPATPKDSRHFALLALKDWVETGKAPDCLCPVAFKNDNPLSAFLEDGVAYEREIFPYQRERTMVE